MLYLAAILMYVVVTVFLVFNISFQSRETTVYNMRMEVQEAGERLKFLMDYAMLSDEDIRLNSQTFNWPARMEPIFEVSQQRLTAQREGAEDKIKERCIIFVM